VSETFESGRHIAEALRASRKGASASEELLALVYDDLRRLARSKLAGLGPGQTLQTTALVHEAWMRLSSSGDGDWEGRAHFFGAAARAMRNILVDQARRKGSSKRNAGREKFDQDTEPHIVPPTTDILALDESLKKFELLEPRKAEVVMLRFFAGLSTHAIAKVLQVSVGTVERDWRLARAWLQTQIEGAEKQRT
jgi:RNA polymerase sigma factor (TIGR02999 family)